MKKIRISSCTGCPQSYYSNPLDIRVCNDAEIVAKHPKIPHRECPTYNVRTDCPLEDY